MQHITNQVKKNLRKETKETKHDFFIWLLISDQVCHKRWMV